MIYINDHIEQLNLEATMSELSIQRREQVLRFRHEVGRRLSAAAYLLLKEGLRQEYGITENPIFGYEKGGKPYLEGHPEIFFNLSHCREAAICMISNQPVGVDIESVHRSKADLVTYTMNGKEQKQIAEAVSPDLEFTRLWTMKEAVLKLTGKGITGNLKEILSDTGNYLLETTVSSNGKYVYTTAQFANNQI